MVGIPVALKSAAHGVKNILLKRLASLRSAVLVYAKNINNIIGEWLADQSSQSHDRTSNRRAADIHNRFTHPARGSRLKRYNVLMVNVSPWTRLCRLAPVVCRRRREPRESSEAALRRGAE